MIAARFPLAAALAAAVAALPSPAGAVEWFGRAGLTYMQDDRWAPEGPKTSLPRLDVDLALDMSGFVYTPDAFTWAAGVGYRRYSQDPSNQPGSVQSFLDYRLRGTLFGNRQSPLTVSGFATRTDGDGSGTGGNFGSYEQTYGGNVAVRLLNRPSLEVGYDHTDGRYTSPSYPTHVLDRDSFTASTGHSTAAYSFNVGYRALLSSGTFASENYDDQRVDLNARVAVERDARVQLSDTFYRRDPTLGSPFNPRQQLNTFSALYTRDHGVNSSDNARYLHVSAVTDSAGSTLTRSVDNLDVDIRRPLGNPAFSILGGVSLNYLDSAAPSGDLRTAGQALRATVYWTEQFEDLRADVHAGPVVALVEPFDGTTQFGYGATAGGGVQRYFGSILASAQYGISYASAAGTLATTLTQSASAEAVGPLGIGQLRATVNASGDRLHDPQLGDSASRTLRANVEFRDRSSTIWLEALYQGGVAFPLRSPFQGDGLFLSPGYDSTSTSLSTGVRGGFAGLGMAGTLRLTNVVAPDRPTLDELELRGEISYRIGAFGMGLEDRYVVDLGGGNRLNVVFFRVYRLFGSRF